MAEQNEAIAAPAEALAALASLRESMGAVLPPEANFGVGFKRKNDQYSDQISLVVFVPQKLPLDQIPEDQVVPPVWSGTGVDYPTDVVESNPKRIMLVNDTARYPTLHGGIEIGWEERKGVREVEEHTGTLGCIVQRRGDGSRLLLTAHHVGPAGTTSDGEQP